MSLTIKDIPIIERPREKMLRYGPERLTNVELIALLLGSGIKGKNIFDLSKQIIFQMNKDKNNMPSIDELQKITGLGIAKICMLSACFELGKRFFQDKQSTFLLSPFDVWNQLYDIREKKKEHFVVFYLDIRNQMVKREIISVGTLNASLVHPREVFEPAIQAGAAQVIISHNHPSGIVEPSDEDIRLTKRLIMAGEILGIEVIDHIIVCHTSYLSLKRQKLM